MDEQYKYSGLTMLSYGVFSFLTCVMFHYYTYALRYSPYAIAFAYTIMVISFLSILCGVYLVKRNTNVHKIALPVSLLILFNFPFGTIAGSFYLWERFRNQH